MVYYTYYIKSKNNNLTYIGITDDLSKRLLKHNSKLGAKATRRFTDWEYIKIVELQSKQDAASLEYYWKHYLTKNSTWRRVNYSNKISRLNDIVTNYNHNIIL